MKERMKKYLKISRQVLIISFLVIILFIGILLYRIFLNYVPGANIADLFQSKIGLSLFHFIGICSGLFITFPVLIGAADVFYRNTLSYIHFNTETGMIHLSDKAIANFILDIVSEIAGVESIEVSVNIFKENKVGIRIWVYTDEKNDFLRFSERIQQRVIQDLEFNFSIKKIKYFHVYVESTNIQSGANGYKVNYQ